MDPTEASFVLVADGRRARLFEERGRGDELREITARLGDLSVRRPVEAPPRASSDQRVGPGSHSGDRPSLRDVREMIFAHHLGLRVIEVKRRGGYGDVLLLAPPRALGRLRRVLKEAGVLLADSAAVDCVKETLTAIRSRLRRLRGDT